MTTSHAKSMNQDGVDSPAERKLPVLYGYFREHLFMTPAEKADIYAGFEVFATRNHYQLGKIFMERAESAPDALGALVTAVLDDKAAAVAVPKLTSPNRNLVKEHSMWRDHDRFPVSSIAPARSNPPEQPPAAARPFGLRFVDYSPGRPRFSRPEVRLCPRRQIGVVEGQLASEVMPMAATMTSFESDGKDVLTLDWATDDK